VRRARRSAVSWLIAVAIAALLHFSSGRALADRDIVASLLVGREPSALLLAVVLLLSRLFLYLLAPGWALHIAVRTWLEKRLRDRTGGIPSSRKAP
jgi:hypothetical protein